MELQMARKRSRKAEGTRRRKPSAKRHFSRISLLAERARISAGDSASIFRILYFIFSGVMEVMRFWVSSMMLCSQG